VAVAIHAASLAHTHLAAGSHAASASSPAAPRWRAWATLVCVGPWALFMLWASWGTVVDATRGLERFPETLTPGYFVLKIALALLLLLVLLQALLAVRHTRSLDGREA